MQPVPEQQFGGQSDNEYRETCTTKDQAIQLYTIACRNLLAINNWKNICNNLVSADFTLVDESGKPVNRFPKEKDFIKIDIPGPGPTEGDGFDWVQIEEIGNESDLANDIEFTYLKVRPSTSPETVNEETAHFFAPEANSTFMVKRSGETVIGEIHGRNEQPNNTTEHGIDNVRNSMVATMAMAKFSDIQWKMLSRAFVTYSNPFRHEHKN